MLSAAWNAENLGPFSIRAYAKQVGAKASYHGLNSDMTSFMEVYIYIDSTLCFHQKCLTEVATNLRFKSQKNKC